MTLVIENLHTFRKVKKPRSSVILTVPRFRAQAILVSEKKDTYVVKDTETSPTYEVSKKFWSKVYDGNS